MYAGPLRESDAMTFQVIASSQGLIIHKQQLLELREAECVRHERTSRDMRARDHVRRK